MRNTSKPTPGKLGSSILPKEIAGYRWIFAALYRVSEGAHGLSENHAMNANGFLSLVNGVLAFGILARVGVLDLARGEGVKSRWIGLAAFIGSVLLNHFTLIRGPRLTKTLDSHDETWRPAALTCAYVIGAAWFGATAL